jgi:predicted acetyltransferase
VTTIALPGSARAVQAVEVRSANLAEKDALDQLLELYLHDLSEMTGADVDRRGRYDYRFLDDYWTEPDLHPFLIRVDGRLAGLALVASGAPHDMAEFFVMRKYRRRGVGSRAALALFAMFPGEWQVRQISANRDATTFWHSVIPVPFREEAIEIGPVQRFRIVVQ